MTANLIEKNGIYQVVISWKDSLGKRRQKWFSTGLSTNGNKRKAEQEKIKIFKEWEQILSLDNYENISFCDYLIKWIENVKYSLSSSSYAAYKIAINNVIIPYFKINNVKLIDLKPYHIQEFYNYKIKVDGVGRNTIHHYHAYISGALKYAVENEFIMSSPAKKVRLPKRQKYKADFYTVEELKIVLESVKDKDIEIAVNIATYLGLRRGEIVGLKWDYVDLENKTITINGAITRSVDGWIYVETAKNKSSLRTLPIPDNLVTYLLEFKEQQERKHKEMQLQGKYTDRWCGFVCVRDNGELLLPDYITRHFTNMCKELGLKHIRFHGLRHSNISMLVMGGHSMKEIQRWAGHSTLATTADIYSHITDKGKAVLSNSIDKLLVG